MGLDNGIVIKNKKMDELGKLPWYVKLEDSNYSSDIEVCYWRKNWGLRGCILGVLHANGQGSFQVDEDDIPAIIRAIEYFIDEEIWENEGQSIWTYAEDNIKSHLLQDIKNLCWLREYMLEHNDIKCEFYDSY